MICPACNGTGDGGAVHVNTGFNERTGRCSGYWKQASECFRCSGKGIVPDEMIEWIRKGKELRKIRKDSGESLHDAAARLGIDICELSAIELGRKAAPESLLNGGN